MPWSPLSPVRRRTHPLQKLSSEKFEGLIHRLVQHNETFEDVHWYKGARDDGRDVVMYRYVEGEKERWYVHCRQHQHVDYTILREELKHLAQHAERVLTFTPHVIVYTAACDIPTNDKKKTTIYARALGLPAPRFWDAPVLIEMLEEQPETKQEFLDELEIADPADEPHPLQQASALLRQVNGRDVVIAGAGLLIAAGLFYGWQALQGQGLSTVTPMWVAQPLSSPTPSPSLTPLPSSTPSSTPSPTPLPTLTPSPTPSPSNTPTDTPRPTHTPWPTPTASPTPTATPAPVAPTLIEPKSGELLRFPIFRWQGPLGNGQFFVLRLEHLATGWKGQGAPTKTMCQQIDLPYELFGGWRWWIDVVAGDTVLDRSESRDIWFDPYLSDLHPTPIPCGK